MAKDALKRRLAHPLTHKKGRHGVPQGVERNALPEDATVLQVTVKGRVYYTHTAEKALPCASCSASISGCPYTPIMA